MSAALLGASGPAPRVRSIAVLDLRAVGVPQQVADSAALLLPTAVRRAQPDAKVISSADTVAVLGLERQKQLLGCAESSCMAELGGALGVDELVTGDLGKLGKTLVLDLRRIDARNARSLGSATRTLESEDELVSAIEGATRELFGAPQPAVARAAANPSAASEVTPAGGSAPAVVAVAPRPLWPKLVLGAGVAIAAVSGAGLIYARGVKNSFDAQQGASATATVTRAQASRAQALDTASLIALPVAAAGVAVGIWGLARGAPVQVAPVGMATGAGVAVAGRF